MGILDHLSNIRYTQLSERYARWLGAGSHARAGKLATPAVAARATAHAEQLDRTAPAEGQAPDGESGGGLLQIVGGAMLTVIGWEQQLTAPLGRISFSPQPALRVWDLDIGLPHAHNHPPNITPPNPVPIALPSFGPVIPIPMLSGASRVLINGRPAVRCGDMGLGIWCGGYFPMFEVFFGSATVWIESARAARVLVDFTKHCVFSAPKPSDPPMGPMFGSTIGPGSTNVGIGGMPFPSLFNLAIAQAFRAVFRIGGAILRRLTAGNYVANLVRNGTIRIRVPPGAPANWADDIMRDLERIARSRAGRQTLNRIARSGNHVNIHPYSGWVPNPRGGPPIWHPHNAMAWADNADGMLNPATGARGAGSNANVGHTPEFFGNHPSGGAGTPPAGTTSDAMLHHELSHAANATEGGMRPRDYTNTSSGWGGDDSNPGRWRNHEEYATTAADNGYRRDTGLPQRANYAAPLQ